MLRDSRAAAGRHAAQHRAAGGRSGRPRGHVRARDGRFGRCRGSQRDRRDREANRARRLHQHRHHLRYQQHPRPLRGPEHTGRTPQRHRRHRNRDGAGGRHPAGRSAAAGGRRLLRSAGRGTGRAVVPHDGRFPLLVVAHGDQTRGDAGRGAVHPHRTGSAGPPGHHRRPRPPPLLPRALAQAHLGRQRCPGHAAGLAFRRRQHLRRRLHPDHGPGGAARGLSGELFPLVRRARGALRLVLRRHPDLRADLHRQPLGAYPRTAVRHVVLDGDQPRGGSAARPQRADLEGRVVDRRTGLPRLLDAL